MKKNPTVTIPVKRRVRSEEPVLPNSEVNAPVRESDRIFLTPRVINAQTYEEMSGDLRQLIDRAEMMTEALQSIVNGAGETAGRMKKVSRRYEERLKLGARLFETVCKRADEVETTSKRINEQTAQIAQLKESVDELSELLNQAQQAAEQAKFAEKQASDTRSQCDAVREMMGEEMIAGAGLIDQLAEEREQLRDVMDAGAIIAEGLTRQTIEKHGVIEKCGTDQLRKIDQETQRQTGKLLSMKSELVGLVVDLDQRTESLRSFMAQYEKLGKAMQSNIDYLKRWERYFPGDDDDGEPVSAVLRDTVNGMREIMDEEFTRLGKRLNRLAEAVVISPTDEATDEKGDAENDPENYRDPANVQIVSRSENRVGM